MGRVRREPSESITMESACEGLEGGERSYTFTATQKVCGAARRLHEAWAVELRALDPLPAQGIFGCAFSGFWVQGFGFRV